MQSVRLLGCYGARPGRKKKSADFTAECAENAEGIACLLESGNLCGPAILAVQ
jgi:hypothetical protein